MIVVIICIVLCSACLAYAVRLSVIYSTFNKNIKDWAKSLDDSTRAAINSQTYRILAELDEKISKNKDLKDEKVTEVQDGSAE